MLLSAWRVGGWAYGPGSGSFAVLPHAPKRASAAEVSVPTMVREVVGGATTGSGAGVLKFAVQRSRNLSFSGGVILLVLCSGEGIVNRHCNENGPIGKSMTRYAHTMYMP